MTPEVLIQLIINILLHSSTYALGALGLTIVFSVMKLMNFAHGTLMILGAYTSYWMLTLFNIDPFISLFFSMSLVFIIGGLIFRLTIKPVLEGPKTVQLLLTLSVAMILENTYRILWTGNWRALHTPYSLATTEFLGITIPYGRLMVLAVNLCIFCCVFILIKKTYLGKAIRAVAQDKETSKAIGVNIYRINLIAFAIGAALAAAAGSLLVIIYPFHPGWGMNLTIKAFVIIVLGGMGSIRGVLVGALVIGASESLTGYFFFTGYKDAAGFLILMVVLLLKPSGLFGEEAGIREEAVRY